MATESNRLILTYDDYSRLPDDGKRYELFEGEIYQMPAAPNLAHQSVVTNLAAVLRPHVRQRQLGRIWVAPIDVVLGDITVLQPDLVFVARERLAIAQRLNIHGAPDLVVEVLSPSTAERDRGAKMQLYARYGVLNYWLFDPDQREARAYVLDGDTYRLAVVAQQDDSFSAPPFPGLAIPLGEIWE